MKPNRMLIDALRRAATRIKRTDRYDYDWMDASCCNCGILAQELLGTSKQEISELFILSYRIRPTKENKKPGIWGNACFGCLCPTTKIPLTKLFNLLFKYGFEDYFDFEMLEFAHKGGKYGFNKEKEINPILDTQLDDPQRVSLFFCQLADELEQKLPVDNKEAVIA